MKKSILFLAFSFVMNLTSFGQSEIKNPSKKYPDNSGVDSKSLRTTPKTQLNLSAANVVFYEDFDNVPGDNSGGRSNYVFPAGWFLRNVDNKTPISNVNWVNDAWERSNETNMVDSVAYSNSWYEPAGQADDWMWTPSITIPNANMKLFWNARAEGSSDGYEVRVMTTQPTGGTGILGNQVSASTLIFNTAAENYYWTAHEVPLSAYANQTIYIGFRNNSVDKWLLLIDDVIVADIMPSPPSSVTIVPNSTRGNSIIKKNGIGFTHESSDANVQIGTALYNDGAFIQTHTNDALNFATNNQYAQMTLTTDGKLGIGTKYPVAPLHVAGQSTISGGGQGHLFNFGSATLFSYTGLEYPSIVADASILSKTTIGAFQTISASDNRIKNIIGLSNNAEDLARLRKIEITNYHMKDVATWGNQTFKKVIAQQVESVYPEVIKHQTATIPDIYALAEKVVYNETSKTLMVSLSKDYEIKVGDKIELVHPEKGKIQAVVDEVSGNSFTVKNWEYATDKIFVFGREVNDFKSVDYDALSMLGISAIQQLAKENDDLKNRFQKIESKNEALEATNNDLMTRLQKLENLFNNNMIRSNIETSKSEK